MSPTILFSSFIHVVTYIKTLFIFMAEYHSTVSNTNICLFLHLLVDTWNVSMFWLLYITLQWTLPLCFKSLSSEENQKGKGTNDNKITTKCMVPCGDSHQTRLELLPLWVRACCPLRPHETSPQVAHAEAKGVKGRSYWFLEGGGLTT